MPPLFWFSLLRFSRRFFSHSSESFLMRAASLSSSICIRFAIVSGLKTVLISISISISQFAFVANKSSPFSLINISERSGCRRLITSPASHSPLPFVSSIIRIRISPGETKLMVYLPLTTPLSSCWVLLEESVCWIIYCLPSSPLIVRTIFENFSGS